MNNKNTWFLEDLETVPKNGIKVMSTFSCGGGSTMGYKLAGCEVIAANDIDSEMEYHYRMNLHPKNYYLCPIKDLLKKPLIPELYNLDILDGSPPCSSFSIAGKRDKLWGQKKHFREGQTEQVLNDLFFDYLDLVGKLKPKVAIAENVKGMLFTKAKGYCKLIINRFRELGYKPQLFLINAADCGVPQNRERVFFIALRADINKPKLELNFDQKHITTLEAIYDIQDLTDDEIRNTAPTPTDLRYWKKTKDAGLNSYHEYLRLQGLKPNFFGNKILKPDEPSWTVVANGGILMHWEKCRRLTFREYKRLGSFPDDYKARTDNIGKYLVGMSVPPKMMYSIATKVIEQWLS